MNGDGKTYYCAGTSAVEEIGISANISYLEESLGGNQKPYIASSSS